MWLFVYHFYVVLLLGIMKTYQAIAIVQLLLYPSTNTPGTHIIHINYHNEVWIRETKAYELILNEIYSTNMAHILAALHSIRKFVIKQSNFSLFPVVGVLVRALSVFIHFVSESSTWTWLSIACYAKESGRDVASPCRARQQCMNTNALDMPKRSLNI